MTTVTITLTDNDHGHVEVNISGMAEPGTLPTPAQSFGEALRAAINELHPCITGMGNNVCYYCDGTCDRRV